MQIVRSFTIFIPNPNTMNALRRRVIVEIDQPYENEVDFGHTKIVYDHNFNPTYNARIYGTVVAVSPNLSFANELEVGDRIYFHYNVVEDSLIDGKLYNVEEDRIFCYVREGVITMVNDWCLLEPHVEHNDVIDVQGKKVKARMKGDLVVGLKEEVSAEYAIVAHVGNNPLGVDVGDVVIMEPNFEFKNTIEGKEYFTSKTKHILGYAD